MLDTPRTDVDRSWPFWAKVTGGSLSEPRGESGQFATLVPALGDPWIKLQAVTDGPGGVHLLAGPNGSFNLYHAELADHQVANEILVKYGVYNPKLAL